MSSKILISPHPDDACIFASFLILSEKPTVVTVLDSIKQGNAAIRIAEDCEAMDILGTGVDFLNEPDDKPNWERVAMKLQRYGQPEMVYAPAVEEGGHPHHNAVGEIAGRIFRNVTFYMTYSNRGKSVGYPVSIEPWMVEKKLRALCCYKSQLSRPEQIDHFLRPQFEYLQ